MKPLRFLVVAWMILWLGASGALAAVMPFCQHTLGASAGTSAAATAEEAAQMHAFHGEHAGHAVHEPAQPHDAHAGIACDGCGSCHLLGSGIPAAPMAGVILPSAGESGPFIAAAFRGHIPEQPYHPPRASLPA